MRTHISDAQAFTGWGGPTSLCFLSGKFDSGTHPLCGVYPHPECQCFEIDTMWELFETGSPDLIIKFIRRAGLIYLI